MDLFIGDEFIKLGLISIKLMKDCTFYAWNFKD